MTSWDDRKLSKDERKALGMHYNNIVHYLMVFIRSLMFNDRFLIVIRLHA